jgi:hypothetical protein
VADKAKKPVDQKTLDMLAKGRAALAAKKAAAKAASPAPAPSTKKPDVPTARAPRCMSCYCRPCDKSGKRCAK